MFIRSAKMKADGKGKRVVNKSGWQGGQNATISFNKTRYSISYLSRVPPWHPWVSVLGLCVPWMACLHACK